MANFDSSYPGALQKARRRNHAPGLTKALSSSRASLSSISGCASLFLGRTKKEQEGEISSPVPPVHTPSEGGCAPPPSDPAARFFLFCNDLPLSKIGDSAARIRCKEEDRPARPVVITDRPTETLGDMGLRVVCGERPGAEVREKMARLCSCCVSWE